MPALPVYTEKSLLQQVSNGDEKAFRELFHRYSDLLGAYVLRLTHSREYTQEIVQDVFLKIWMSREVLAEIENFNTYLYVVSRNQTLNALRKISRERDEHTRWEKTHASSLHDEATNEEHAGLHGLIDSAINQLPEQQKKAWLLSRSKGLTHKQVAKEMDLSRETVKKYIMYANQSLTRFIKSHFS